MNEGGDALDAERTCIDRIETFLIENTVDIK